MLIYEKDAMLCVCPLSFNNHEGDSFDCMGAQCMAWRWFAGPWQARQMMWASNPRAEDVSEAGPIPKGCEGWEFCPIDDGPACWLEPEEKTLERRRGYCGMGQKPMEVVKEEGRATAEAYIVKARQMMRDAGMNV